MSLAHGVKTCDICVYRQKQHAAGTSLVKKLRRGQGGWGAKSCRFSTYRRLQISRSKISSNPCYLLLHKIWNAKTSTFDNFKQSWLRISPKKNFKQNIDSRKSALKTTECFAIDCDVILPTVSLTKKVIDQIFDSPYTTFSAAACRHAPNFPTD